MTLYYADGVNGNDGNDGLSEANAKQTLQAAIDLLSGGGNTIYAQATGNYTLGASLVCDEAGTNAAGRNWIEGYTTTPGALDGKPTITCATNGVHLVTLGANYLGFKHLKLTHTAGTRGDGFRNVASTSAEFCIFEDLEIDGCQIGIDDVWNLNTATVIRCMIHNCVSHGLNLGSNIRLFANTIRNNGGCGWSNPFGAVAHVIAYNTIADNSSHGIHLDGNPGFLSDQLIAVGNKIANNGGDAVRIDETTATQFFQLIANIIWGNGGYGVDMTALGAIPTEARTFLNAFNAYGSNTSGARNNFPAGYGDVALTADPFVDAANGDYDLNEDAGGGAVLRASTFAMP